MIYSPDQAKAVEQEEKIEKRNHVIKFVSLIIGIIVIFVLLLIFVIQPFEVDGISMQPTLHTGNILLVWKFPQSWAELTNSQYIPNRGNIVIIKKSPILGEQLVKRVIGLPGDKVVIANNQVNIYNYANPSGFNPDAAPFGKDLQPTIGNFNTTVGSGQIFVMGDNRTIGASIDSRSSLGNVPSGNIIGQVVLRIYPFKIF